MTNADLIKQQKNSEELIKVIGHLTKTLEGKTPESKKKDSLIGALKTAISTATVKPIKETIKNMLAPGGIATALANRSGTLGNIIFGGIAEHQKGRAEQLSQQKDWIKNYLEGTEKGRESLQKHGVEKATQIAREKYIQTTNIKEQIEKLNEIKRQRKESGVKGADLTEEESERLKHLESALEKITLSKTEIDSTKDKQPEKIKPEPVTAKQIMEHPEFEKGVKEGITEELKKLFTELNAGKQKETTTEQQSRKQDTDIPDLSEVKDQPKQLPVSSFNIPKEISDHPDFDKGISEGIEEELLKLNEDQLKQLKKLVAASTKDQLEKTNEKYDKKSSGIVGEKLEQAKDQVKEKSKSLLESAVDKVQNLKKIKDVITNAGSIIKRGAGSVLTKTGNLLSTASRFGNSGLAKTGEIAGNIATRASGVASGVAGAARAAIPVAGNMLSGAVSAAAPALATAANAALPLAAVAAAGYGGYKLGEVVTDKFLTNEDGSNKIARGAETARDWIKSSLGMETDEEKIKKTDESAALELGKKKLAEGKPISSEMAERMKSAGYDIKPEQIVRPKPVQNRERATEIAERTNDSISNKTEQKKVESPIVNNVVTSNNSTIYNERPNARTPEPTFNRYLASRISFA